MRRYSDLKSKRDGVFMSDWQYISQYFLPQDSDIQSQKTEGVSGWTDLIFDTTAIEAAETLKTGQYNWLTPPQQPWAEYAVPEEMRTARDDTDEKVDDATAFFGRCSDIVMRELARSNFYSIASMSYLGVGVFGTDLVIVEEGKKTSLVFRHCRIGTYCIEEDEEGIVDTTFREFEMTFRQAKQLFSKPGDVIPEKMAAQATGSSGLKKKFKFIHAIFPREDSKRLPNRKDGPNKPIASVYFAPDFIDQVIRVSGYDEQPALCSRFDKWGSDSPWGYGPAYLALPIARQLNYVQQFLDALAELHAYPRVLVPDSLDGDVDLRAGGTTVIDSTEGAAKPEEWATVGDYKLGLEMQEQRREALRDAFKTKAFKLLNSQPLLDKKMTAYEIAQHQAEQLGDFTPSFARRVTEFLNPLLLRVFGVLYRQGKFGKAPDSLLVDVGNGKRGLVMPSVVVTNRITNALRALQNRSIEETFAFVMPLVKDGQKPELLDVFDMDDVVREYSLGSGMAPDLLRRRKGKNSVEGLRAQRAKVQQEMRASQMAEQLGKAGAGLGKSPQFMQDSAKEAMSGNKSAA